jgi:hypothetical protein
VSRSHAAHAIQVWREAGNVAITWVKQNNEETCDASMNENCQNCVCIKAEIKGISTCQWCVASYIQSVYGRQVSK